MFGGLVGRALPFFSRSSWAFGFLALIKHFSDYLQSRSGLQHYIPVYLLLYSIVDHNTQILFSFSNELFPRAFAVQHLTIHTAQHASPMKLNPVRPAHTEVAHLGRRGRKECTGNDIPSPR
jgi:hypothetical protein